MTSIPIHGLAHVGIRVHDLERSLGFYQRLGFTLTAGPVGPEPVAILDHPSGLELNLILNAAAAAEPNVLMDVADKHAGITHIAILCPDLDAARRDLAAAGIPLSGGPVQFTPTARGIFVRDPDRNVIELHQRTAPSRADTVRTLLDRVWTQGDLDAADPCVAARYTIFHDPGDPWDGQTLDLAGYKDRARTSRAPFPDQRFEIHDLLAEGDRVCVTWRWTGTHQGDLPGFPASNRRISTSGATVYSFDGARISGHWQSCDRLAVFQQLSR